MLGLDDKAMGISNKTIKKANIGKHDVPLDVLEELPEYIFDPIAVLDSKTNKGSLVSILNAVDKNGDTVVAIIKPTKGKYNVIPSVYGKDDLDNLIKSSKIRYKDIERANIAIRPSSLQLLGVDNTVGSLTKSNISPTTDNVNTLSQGKNYQGFFDTGLKTIVIGSKFNFGTLQHEFAHFFLDRMFDIYKSGTGTTEFNEWFADLMDILTVNNNKIKKPPVDDVRQAGGFHHE